MSPKGQTERRAKSLPEPAGMIPSGTAVPGDRLQRGVHDAVAAAHHQRAATRSTAARASRQTAAALVPTSTSTVMPRRLSSRAATTPARSPRPRSATG